MNKDKNRVLFPLACCAVLSVATFSGIGVAAITGQLAVSPSAGELFSPSTELHGRSKSHGEAEVAAVARPTHAGLTRKAINNASEDEKPMVIRVGNRFSQTLKPACDRCGVVDSIERHKLQMPEAQSAAPHLVSASLEPTNANGFTVPTATRNRSGIYTPSRDVATSFIVRLRMEDGSIRTIYEHQQPKFSVGEKVQLIDGSVVSLG